MKTITLTIFILFSLMAFAGDMHMGKHVAKAGFKSAKFSGKMLAKSANKVRKQVL